MPYVSTLSVFLPSLTRSTRPARSRSQRVGPVLPPCQVKCLHFVLQLDAVKTSLLIDQSKNPNGAAARHVSQLFAHAHHIDAAETPASRGKSPTTSPTLPARSSPRRPGSICWRPSAPPQPAGSGAGSSTPPGSAASPRLSTSTRWSAASCRRRRMPGPRTCSAHVGRGDSEREYWVAQARRVLSGLLHAAALGGATMDDVLAWVAAPDTAKATVLAYLRRSPAPAYVADVAQFLSTNDKTRSSITSTIMPALSWLTVDTAVAAAAPAATSTSIASR